MNHDDERTRGSNSDRPNNADPFDLDSLRLSQDFASSIGLKKLLTTVPVKKPNSQTWVRVHPDEAFRLPTAVLEMKEEKEIYLVDRELWPELGGEIIPKMLYTAITQPGDVFIWPVRMPGEDGRLDDWNESAHRLAKKGMEKWVRVQSNRKLGANEGWEAQGDIPDPEWPDIGFREILSIAFKDRRIQSLDHPILRALRGEI